MDKKKREYQEIENESIRTFLGKEFYQYAFPINDFIEGRRQDCRGIQACDINSFIAGRKAFLEEIHGGTIYGCGRSILLRRWLDHCENFDHFKEVFLCAVKTQSYGLKPKTVVWEWIKRLETKKQFMDFFKVINESPSDSDVDKEMRLYAMQMFINSFMK